MTTNQHSPFKAIADPTRREIIALLVDAKGPLPITSITEHFDKTRQAVTKHIKVLHSAGLIEIRKSGRERYCTVSPLPLKDVYDWVVGFMHYTPDKEVLPPNGRQESAAHNDSPEKARETHIAHTLELYRAASSM